MLWTKLIWDCHEKIDSPLWIEDNPILTIKNCLSLTRQIWIRDPWTTQPDLERQGLPYKTVALYLVRLVVLAGKWCLLAISCIFMLTGDEKEIFRTQANHNQILTVAKSLSTTQDRTKVMNSLFYSKEIYGVDSKQREN